MVTELQENDLLYDTIFKQIFLEDPTILVSLIKDAINFDFDEEKDNITILNEIVLKDKFYDKDYYTDILLLIRKDTILNIEVNRNDYSLKKSKRMVKYLNSLYGRDYKIKEGIGLAQNKELNFIQVHLNIGGSKTKELIAKYNIRSDDPSDLFIENYNIWTINLDKIFKKVAKYKNIEYNKCDKKLLRLAVFCEGDLKEIEKLMLKGGINYNMTKKLTDIIAEKLASDEELVQIMFPKRDREQEQRDALEYRESIGREEGREEGITQKQYDVFENMLNLGLDEDTIKKALNISQKEFATMQKQLHPQKTR